VRFVDGWQVARAARLEPLLAPIDLTAADARLPARLTLGAQHVGKGQQLKLFLGQLALTAHASFALIIPQFCSQRSFAIQINPKVDCLQAWRAGNGILWIDGCFWLRQKYFSCFIQDANRLERAQSGNVSPLTRFFMKP
jgi:hypothetical protein